jgi:hypothetical protein
MQLLVVAFIELGMEVSSHTMQGIMILCKVL